MSVRADDAPGKPERANKELCPSVDDIERGLRVLHPAEAAIEVRAPGLRAPGSDRPLNVVQRFGPGAFRAAAVAAHKLSGKAPAVYVVMNGVDPGLPRQGRLEGGAKAADVPRRLRLLIDVDPPREGTCSATDPEKAAAVAVGAKVRAFLRARSWTEPLIGDSGNGDHSVYAIDLPNTPESTELVKAALTSLAARFDTAAAKIDTKVYDPPRLVKCYGTKSCKGPDAPDRPHRYSRVIGGPAELVPVPEQLLRELAAEAPPPAPTPGPTLDLDAEVERKRGQRPGNGPATARNGAGVEVRAVAYLAACPPAVAGQDGHNRTFATACRVGPGFDLPPETAFRLIIDHYNPRCQPPWTDRELQHKIEDAYKKETRRGWLRDAARNGPPTANGAAHPAGPGGGPSCEPDGDEFTTCSDEDLGIVPLETVACRAIEWEWKYRFARGHLSLTAGDGGLGKSTLLLWVAATKSTGGEWPDGAGRAVPGNVVVVSAEDSAEDVIKPRLVAMGADLAKIYIVKAKYTIRRPGKLPEVHPASFQDRRYWHEVLKRLDCRLFVVDPLPSYLGRGVNDAKNVEIRNVLEPFLADVVAPLKVCMIGNTHLNKSIDAKTPLHRITGSIAYANLPRNVHFVVRDPDETDRRFLKQAKCNLAPDDLPALAFRIERREITTTAGEVIETAIPVFEPETVVVDLHDAVNGGGRKGRRGPDPKKTTAATEWLFDFLRAEGRAVPIAAVFDAAGEAGFAGTKAEDGTWSVPGTLYTAVKRVPDLPAPRDGFRVEVMETPLKPGGRKIKHWYLCGAESAY